MDYAQINISTHEVRRCVDGDPAFPDNVLVGTIRLLEGQPITDLSDVHSSVTFTAFDPDMDKQDKYPIRVSYFLDPGPIVAIQSEQILPIPLLDQLRTEILSQLRDADRAAFTRMRRFANRLEHFPLRALRRKIIKIEDSVREALDDEQIDQGDFRDLRAYPKRLAAVQSAAQFLWDNAPEIDQLPPRATEIDPIDRNPFPSEAIRVGDLAIQAVSSLSALISSQQIVISQAQAAATARFQRLLTFVGAVILVPGLVAGIFGANVDVPADDTSQGFWAMLLIMLGCSIASCAALLAYENEPWKATDRRRRVVKVVATYASALLLAIAAFIGAVSLISDGEKVQTTGRQNTSAPIQSIRSETQNGSSVHSADQTTPIDRQNPRE